MCDFVKKKFREIRGFTLIEMMVVLVIIALLILIALPSWQNYVDTAQQVKSDADQRIYETSSVIDEM